MSPKGRGGGKGSRQQAPEAKQTGAAFGTQVIRLSGIHGLGMVVSNILTFVAAIVIANFSDPAEFGQLGLLQFFAGLMTLLFTLAVKQGTLKRTFGGGDDDDDDDDDDDEELSLDPRHSFGTGLITITIVSLIGTGLALLFRVPITNTLLGGGADPNLLVWAAIAGGAGALYRLTSIAIWIERRPYAYIAVETSKPVFTLGAVVPLLIAGLGVEGAILGQAIGTVIATLISLVVLWSSWTLTWDWREARAIYQKGAIRIPLVLSMWVVGYFDIFILSRFVSHAELGTYHLASKAAFLVAVLPGGYRKALRPLQKTPMFKAVEDEYGVGTARGIQFGYFTLMLVGTLLLTTIGAHALLRIAPESYADSAPLIPIIAAGLVAPTVYRMVNKSVKYADKRVPFIIGAITAAVLFVGLSLLLVPRLGVVGTPLAMIFAFGPPSVVIFVRSQRGRSPIKLPWRMILVTVFSALLIGWLHGLVTIGGLLQQTLLGIAAMAAWVGLVLAFGGIPREHRLPLWMMFKGLRRKGRDFDGVAALETLSPPERRALRRAIKRGMKPQKAIEVLGKDPINEPRAGPEAILVHLLRRAADGGGVRGLPDNYGQRSRPRKDEQIGRFLFARGTIAERDQLGKKLVNEEVTDAFDLHTLEVVLDGLEAMPGPAWGGGSTN